MNDHADCERADRDFLDAFFATTLPRCEWTHTAHVRMAFLTLAGAENFDAGLERIREGIRRYNAAQGNHTGYHETITVAFAHLVAAASGETPGASWTEFASAHPTLLGAGALDAHYDPATLRSADARARFVPPDRAALPLVVKR